MTKPAKSVFAEFAWKIIERGISVVPIAPGTKKPGQWSQERGWEGMGDWTRFAKRLPTQLELEFWETWPDAGIGVVLGEFSDLVGLDKDYDIPNGGNDALQAIIPHSPVAKKGEKGWTRLYRYNGERSCSFDVNGARVLDVLSDGRQTVVPPTAHPCGLNYTWITLDTLDEITSTADLPKLPDDFLEQVSRVLAPYQTEVDKQSQRRQQKPKDVVGAIDTSLSIQAQFFRQINEAALARLDDWVPQFVPTARQDANGFRAVATWRGCTNANVGVTPDGIRDWGGNYGMTPIDLVMYANNLNAMQAADALRGILRFGRSEPLTMTVGGVPIGQDPPAKAPAPPSAPVPPPAPAPAPPPIPARLPWQPKEDPPTAPAAIILPPTTSAEPSKALPRFITTPPGILKDVADWITATAPKSQPELSLAGAIALGAVCTQRIYRSNHNNFTSMYVVLVGKSTEGKEHPQSSVEKILTAADLTDLLGGSGYTSAGAVFSTLLRAPSHISMIDEIGKLLKISRAKGNANSEAAIDKLIEAYGRLDGVMRPPSYSTMTLSKSQLSQMSASQVVHNPAITILGATTPGTFYGALTDDLVKDGFLGRLLVVESTLPRQLLCLDENRPGVPERVVDWCKAVHSPAQRQGNLADIDLASMPAHIVEMRFSAACRDLLRGFEAELNLAKDQLEPEGLDVLLGRTHEKAMRLAMIAAKAVSADLLSVGVEHLEWAIDYVRHYDMALVEAVRHNRVRSQVDGDIKRLRDYVAGARKFASDPKLARFAPILANGGMPRQILLKRMHMSAREFDSVVLTAYEAGIINKAEAGQSPGYAGEVYYLNGAD